MKKVMKTIGILSLTLALFTLISWSPLDKGTPIENEMLYSMATTIVISSLDDDISEAKIVDGIIVGTENEMDSYLELLEDEVLYMDDDRLSELQGLRLYDHQGKEYAMFESAVEAPSPIEIACESLYYQHYILNKAEYQVEANIKCKTISMFFICPYNGAVYAHYKISPNIPCISPKELHLSDYATP